MDTTPKGNPIVMSAGVGTSAVVKAPINSMSNLSGDGFVVWSSMKSAESNSYADVFGPGGTKVYYPDWNYSPIRYWNKGTYKFSAVLPASAFNADFIKNGDNSSTSGFSGEIDDDGNLTLDFGNSGLNLADNQIDLMVACGDANNASGTSPGQVTFSFQHQLAMVSFKANIANSSRSTIRIDAITIYGNAGSASEATFTRSGNTFRANFETTGSTEQNPYIRKEGAWTTSGVRLVENLMVFPERNGKFTLKVDYTETLDGTSKTDTQSVEAAFTWTAGNKYLYEFTISTKNIIFGVPTVVPWSDPVSAEGDIQM